jgi:transcriptional regulator with XRE-family HTH domain
LHDVIRLHGEPGILDGMVTARSVGSGGVEDRVLSQTDIHQPAEIISPEPDRVTVEEPSFAHLLENLRLSRGLSKADLAKRAGVDPSSITRFEQGTRAPERTTVLTLSQAMVLPMSDRDRLLAAAGFRSELWDDPLLIELAQLLSEPSIPVAARNEVRSVIRMAVAYCKLQRLEQS